MSNLYNLLKTIIEKLNATKDAVNSLPQPDWNQNDETAHDHVKNRPFYTSDPVETVLVEESTVTFADTGYGFYAAEFPSTFEATVGETYKVYWDGTAYECTCVKFNNKPAIGNLSIAGAGSDTGEPFIIGIFNGERIQIIIADTSSSHTISISGFAQEVVKIDEKYLPDTLLPFKPAGKSYLTFSSLNSFTLAVNDATKHWDGTLEYFASDRSWTTWDGTSALSAVSDDGKYVLYLRGTGNTVITGYSEDIPYSWVLTGTDISSVGNIENLLDYTTVTSGGHPTMANSCYKRMFYGCTSLTHAPALPATVLAAFCYDSMFYGCTSLKLSSTQTGEYTQEYRVYYLKYGTVPTNAFDDMFTSTGGTFTGTPTFTTTYYLSSDNMIVRDTEIANLNGYVGSMIDAAGEAEAPDWNELDSTSHSYIKNKPFERSLVATFISKHSLQGPAVLGDPQDTPRLEIGKTYYVYVNGSLSFSAECVVGGLWSDTGTDHRVLKAPIDDGSSGNRNAICERISDNTLYAVTRSYDEMWKTGLPVEIYKVEKLHPDVLPIQPVDSTLTQSGQAADAAEVGNRLSALFEEIENIPRGKDGVGIQSVAQTTTSAEDGGTNVVTVTKTDGTTSTFSIKNGSKGSEGPAGANGHTPVKGTDYWTTADQQAIVDDVLAALPAWEGGSY